MNGTCVYGPSLAPADRCGEQVTEVAAGHTTSLRELAMLMSYTADPCECWEKLGYGRAAILYRRTQVVLEASRQLPAQQSTSRCLSEWVAVEAFVGSAGAYPHVSAIFVAHWEWRKCRGAVCPLHVSC